MAILTNKKWQAYEDAETLARYKDLTKRASLMQRAAGGKITTKNKK